MNHDIAHEEKQNAALRLLAGAIEGVAAHIGYHLKLRGQLEEILGVGEAPAEPAAEPAPPPEAAVAPAEPA